MKQSKFDGDYFTGHFQVLLAPNGTSEVMNRIALTTLHRLASCENDVKA